MEPRGKGFAATKVRGLVGQGQEDRLGRVFGILFVTQQPAAGAQNRRAVTPDEFLERFLAAVAREPVEQLVVLKRVHILIMPPSCNPLSPAVALLTEKSAKWPARHLTPPMDAGFSKTRTGIDSAVTS